MKGKEHSLREQRLGLAHLSTNTPNPKWNNYVLLPLFIVPVILPDPLALGLATSMILLLLAKTHLLRDILFSGWEIKTPKVLVSV